VIYCCAGHNHPYIIRKDGSVEEVEPPIGLAICLKDDFHYKTGRLVLEPGDMIFLYTDGVNEAVNAAREEFGVERMTACLRGSSGTKPVEVIRDMLREVEKFSGGIDQSDDITMLALQFLG